MKKVILVIVVIGIVAGIAGGWWYFNKGNAKKVSFRTTEVTRGDILSTISATGTVEPEELVDVGAKLRASSLPLAKMKTAMRLTTAHQLRKARYWQKSTTQVTPQTSPWPPHSWNRPKQEWKVQGQSFTIESEARPGPVGLGTCPEVIRTFWGFHRNYDLYKAAFEG